MATKNAANKPHSAMIPKEKLQPNITDQTTDTKATHILLAPLNVFYSEEDDR